MRWSESSSTPQEIVTGEEEKRSDGAQDIVSPPNPPSSRSSSSSSSSLVQRPDPNPAFQAKPKPKLKPQALTLPIGARTRLAKRPRRQPPPLPIAKVPRVEGESSWEEGSQGSTTRTMVSPTKPSSAGANKMERAVGVPFRLFRGGSITPPPFRL